MPSASKPQSAKLARPGSQEADLDDMLDDKALVDAKNAFWKRHKLRFPPEIMPADSLVSRCSREMSKRMLMVFNVHSAKNLKYQVTTSRKRKHLAADLYTEQDEVVEDARDTREYLDKLMTYMLALAVAGINHTDKDQSQEAVLGSRHYLLRAGPVRRCLELRMESEESGRNHSREYKASMAREAGRRGANALGGRIPRRGRQPRHNH